MNWHLMSINQITEKLGSSIIKGLSSGDAAEKLKTAGFNELTEKSGRTPLHIIREQITATMVLILIAAAVISALLGDIKNTTAIMSIVILFVALGFIQEYRAEKAISALKQMSVPSVKVLRDGQPEVVSARNIVPGDIVFIETGNLIPADMRLIEAVNLRIQEAALTGESEPVEKKTEQLNIDDLPLGDRINMAFMGTVVTQGRGTAVVVNTGMDTELGMIAYLIQSAVQEPTPLQKRLDSLGRTLALIGILISAFIFAVGVMRGDNIKHMLLTAVSVAVAIVPEGLPAVVTITLALGAQRMLGRKALIRKLPAVETLGSVTVICSDKTGTLTENRMTVVVLDVAGHTLDLSCETCKSGQILQLPINEEPFITSVALAAAGGALCNDTSVVMKGGEHYHLLGDPTETALVSAAHSMGYYKNRLEEKFPRVAEVPFDSERKMMTTVHDIRDGEPDFLPGIIPGENRYIAFTKGGVDGLLEAASHIWFDGKAVPMDEEWKKRILTTNEQLASRGMRVLGVAFRLHREIPGTATASLEKDLTMAGMFGMIDPPRKEVREAVSICRTAGIRPVMITGDHPLTAVEIARQLGITENMKALTGAELEKMDGPELGRRAEEVSVFARVAPEHKLRIVQALQDNGHIVSMTGDGVNDAPALRRADIGVAMGITGTDVSKEASDLVLLDDNFATIVSAVKEGRTIYDNIRKFVRFSVAGNTGKVLVMLLAPFLGKPVPLLPLHLLWLNLLTDGMLGLGIGVEHPEPDTMKRRPYNPGEGVFSRGAGAVALFTGLLIGALALATGSWYFFTGKPQWRTMIFTSLAFMQVFQVLASRSEKESFFRRGMLTNRLLLIMVFLVVALQCAVIYIPAARIFFDITYLGVFDMSICIISGLVVFISMEIVKKLSYTDASN